MKPRHISDKRDRVHQLHIFCEVVRAGSISRASEHLDLSQPAASLQVRELEYDLGAILFDRTSTGVSLTPAGERFHELARPLVQGVDEMFDDFRKVVDTHVQTDWVNIAASNAASMFILPPYCKRFRDRYPHFPVRVASMSVTEGIERLLDGRTDLACGIHEAHPEDVVSFEEVVTSEVVLITPPGHPLAAHEQVSLHEAGTYRMIAPSTYGHRQIFGEDHADQAHPNSIDADTTIKVGNWNDVKRYVETGIGIAAIPKLCLKQTDRLSMIALDPPIPRRSYGVYFPHGRILTPSAQHFLEVLVPNVPGSTPYR